MKETNDGDAPKPNYRYGIGIGRSNQRRSAWAETEKESESGDSRSPSQRDIATVARLREAVNRSSPGSKWADIAVVFGAILLAASVLLTLITVLGINARANRLVASDIERLREGGVVTERLEGKIDSGISAVEDNGRKLDSLLTATTTATTNAPRTTTTRASRTTTATTRPTPPTTTFRTPPTVVAPSTTFVAPATTSPPCRLAILNICLTP